MKKKWIKTSEMIAELKLNPNMTLEYEHYLGGPLPDFDTSPCPKTLIVDY